MVERAPTRLDIEFDNNQLLPLLYGEADANLRKLEDGLDVTINSRGNTLTISGAKESIDATHTALDALWDRLKRDLPVGPAEIDAAVRIACSTVDSPTRELALEAFSRPEFKVSTKRKPITARSPTQAAYLQAMQTHPLTFGLGPAGTGKTYLAVAQAVGMLLAGEIDRIVLTRPAVEAGERLGFLPGDLREKIDPYLRPIYDALHDMLSGDQVARRLATGEIEIAPLAFMRGRTLSNSFVILDEAQNTTAMQMKMALTRLGENSHMVVTGDSSQTDLPGGERSGLIDAVEILQNIGDVAVVQFTKADVVRHSLVGKIIDAYDRRDAKSQKSSGKTSAKKWNGKDA